MYGRTSKYYFVFQLHVRHGKDSVEEVEEEILCVGASEPVHLRYLQLQGEEVRPLRDAPDGRLHSGLYRTCWG